MSARNPAIVPEDRPVIRIAPLLLLLVAVALVVEAPSAHLSWFDGNAQLSRQLPMALSATAIWGCTVAYLYLVWRGNALHFGWLITTSAYMLMLAVIKFVLSPNQYSISTKVSSGALFATGSGVAVLYLLALALIAFVVHRVSRNGIVPLRWKIALVIAVGIIATAFRSLAAPILGVSATNYLSRLFSGSGAVLIVALLVLAAVAIQSFEYATKLAVDGSQRTGMNINLKASVAVVVCYHALWFVFMVRLLS